MPVFSSFLMLFSDSSEFNYVELVGVSVDEIRELSPKLMDTISLAIQVRGLYLLIFALCWAIISLVPFRKGEKWAWFALLIIGGIWLFGYLFLVNAGVESGIYLSSWLTPGIVWVLLWIVGLVLSAKDIFRKTQPDLSQL